MGNNEQYSLSFTAEEVDERLRMAGDAVLFTEQTLTDEQKARARSNLWVEMAGGINLFDPSTLISGKYFQYWDGLLADKSELSCCYIPIQEAGTYTFMFPAFKVSRNIPLFDKDKNFLRYIAATDVDGTNETQKSEVTTITIMEEDFTNVAYLGFVVYNPDIVTVMFVVGTEYPNTYIPYDVVRGIPEFNLTNETVNEKQNNPLYKKVIAFNGDSICEGAGDTGGYAKYIGENNKMTVQNIGVSGGTIAYSALKYADAPNYYHCISRTIAEMREDADYIILEGGVNDLYSSDITLGTISDGYNTALDDTTFYGAFENMLKQALIRFPGKKIGYIAVHKMTEYFDSEQTEDNAYHAAIKCCKKWGIPVLDLNITCPPFGYLRNDPDTVFIANTYTANTETAGVGDGWHPNEAGYKAYYVPKIEAWLKTL